MISRFGSLLGQIFRSVSISQSSGGTNSSAGSVAGSASVLSIKYARSPSLPAPFQAANCMIYVASLTLTSPLPSISPNRLAKARRGLWSIWQTAYVPVPVRIAPARNAAAMSFVCFIFVPPLLMIYVQKTPPPGLSGRGCYSDMHQGSGIPRRNTATSRRSSRNYRSQRDRYCRQAHTLSSNAGIRGLSSPAMYTS